MSFLGQIYYYILFQPLLNGLVLLYWLLKDLGLAVIALTLLIKILLMPSSIKAFRSQKQIQLLQPKIKELQGKLKGDKAQQSKALFDLYKKEGVSPAGGCLPILLQLPIIIALYQVFLRAAGQEPISGILYGFMPRVDTVKPLFLGLISFQNTAFVIIIAFLAALAQFLQTKIANSPKPNLKKGIGPDFNSALQKQMLYMLPILSFFLIWKFGALIGLYWLASTVFSLFEQYIANKTNYGKKTNKTN